MENLLKRQKSYLKIKINKPNLYTPSSLHTAMWSKQAGIDSPPVFSKPYEKKKSNFQQKIKICY